MEPAAEDTHKVFGFPVDGRLCSGIYFMAFKAVNPVTPYLYKNVKTYMESVSGIIGSSIYTNEGTLNNFEVGLTQN